MLWRDREKIELLPGNKIVHDRYLIKRRKSTDVAINEPKYPKQVDKPKNIPARTTNSIETAPIILILLILLDDIIIWI